MTPGSPSFGNHTILRPQLPSSLISLLQVAAASSIFNFVVTNPATSYNAVAVSPLVFPALGSEFRARPPGLSALRQGRPSRFTLTFAAATSGTYTGSLSIGTRQFAFRGLRLFRLFRPSRFNSAPSLLPASSR